MNASVSRAGSKITVLGGIAERVHLVNCLPTFLIVPLVAHLCTAIIRCCRLWLSAIRCCSVISVESADVLSLSFSARRPRPPSVLSDDGLEREVSERVSPLLCPGNLAQNASNGIYISIEDVNKGI